MTHTPAAVPTRINKEDDSLGTGLMGYVEATYDELVHGFGRPLRGVFSEKIQAEWIIKFDDGCVATIYDYEEGTPPEMLTRWHVGGNARHAACEHIGFALDRSVEEVA